MNRTLLAAVAAVATVVSSQAIAASYTIDAMTSGDFFAGTDGAQSMASVVGGLARSVTYTPLTLQPGSTADNSGAYFGDETSPFLDIANDPGIGTNLTVHYDIAPLVSQLTAGPKAVTFTVFASDAAGTTPTTISVKQNGSLLGTWTASGAIPGATPGYAEKSSFALNAFTGSDTLDFYVTTADGYDLSVRNFAIEDVSPVPEPGEWAMLVAGMGVIGAAASRRRGGRQL